MHAIRAKVIILTITSLFLTGAAALSATFNELAQMGDDAMKDGKYDMAIKHFEKIVAKGKTYENLLSIKFDLAWAYYLTGAFAKAIPLFDSLSGIRAPSESVRKQSLFLLAECHARLAGTQPEGDSSRKKNLKNALKLHTKFQKAYPKNPNIPQSLYGRAYAYYLDRQLDNAEADLKSVINRFPANPTARDAMYLLGSVYSEHALDEIKQGNKKESKENIDKARDIFSKLSKAEGSNLAIANDSMFSLAETWFSAKLYLEAIRYYQQVRSKAEVLRNIKTIEINVRKKLAEAYGKKKETSLIRVEADKLRAQQNTVIESPDLMISSYFRIADGYYRIQRYDEVRAVCRHLLQFTQNKKQQQANFLIINSYLEEKNAQAADREFQGFQETFGRNVPMADTAGVAIGQLYVIDGDIENALLQFTKSVDEYPEGKMLEDAIYMKFSTQYMLEKYQGSKETISSYLKKYPDGKYVANALYYKAMCHASTGEWDEALKTISEVIERFPQATENFVEVDEAFFQKGWILSQMEKWSDAVENFETFLERFKESRLRPEAMYHLGVALNKADQFDKAKAVMESISKEYPDHYIAPLALYQVAVMYFEKEDFPHMAVAIEKLIQAYPEDRIVIDGYFWLGWISKKDTDYDKAIENFKKCLEFDPKNERAPECMLSIAQSYNEKAKAMGLPTVLPDEKRAVYRSLLLKAARAFEVLMSNYPDSDQTLSSVPGIAGDIFDLVRFRQMTEADAVDYFKKAETRHKDDPGVRAQLLFSMGSFLMKNNDKEKALAAFKKSLATDPDVRLSPVMLSEYAEALKDADSLEQAENIYDKIIVDYADDPRALAPAWFGLADIKYRENNFEAAKELFEKVLKEFPWYEQGKQGRVKLATILERNKNYTEAEKMFEEVWKQEKGEARLGAMLGVSRCQLAQARIAKKAGRTAAWRENIKVADENLTKIIVLFEAYPEYVSEALWIKGQAYELLGDKQKARETYSRLVLKYKKYKWVKLAKERLNELGGIVAAPTESPAP